MHASAAPTNPGSEQRRTRAVVALRLLEVIRDQDVPIEVLEEEDPTVTMPRRLGLSDVVERQIRSYRDDVKRRVRLSDTEIRDLFRLVIRRPDAEEIFYKVGRILAGDEPRKAWRRMLPARVAMALSRGRVRRRLKRLFGRGVGGFGRGGFSIEGRTLLFIDADPGGDACSFLSGFCEAILEQVAGRPARVTHSLCQGRKDHLCRWEGALEEPVQDVRVASPDGSASEADDAGDEADQGQFGPATVVLDPAMSVDEHEGPSAETPAASPEDAAPSEEVPDDEAADVPAAPILDEDDEAPRFL